MKTHAQQSVIVLVLRAGLCVCLPAICRGQGLQTTRERSAVCCSLAIAAPANAPAELSERAGHITFRYDDKVMFDAVLLPRDADPDRRTLTDTADGVVTQVVKWTARGGEPLVLSGTIRASDQAFPAEVDRRESALPVVRHSVGLSHSLLNRAVYDRARDWVLSIDFPARGTIEPMIDSLDARAFRLTATGSEIALRFRPRYYQRHRGLAEFRPWTYRVKQGSVAGWSSWYAFRDQITEADIRRTAAVLADSLAPYGYEYLQLDDGFQQTPIGTPDHWLHTNVKFPSGLEGLAATIAARGLVPGLWTNAAFPDDWALAHPQYFVRDANGKPAAGNWIGYVMDGSNTATLDSLVRPVYRALRRMGWRYFKLDALRHLRYEGYNSHAAYFARTGHDLLGAYRGFVQAIRDEIGPDAFLLASWGIRPELTGLIDGTRVGTDGFGYGGFAQYNSFNNVVWRNDPDHIELAQADAYRAVSLTSLTGSLLMLTDPPAIYASPRVDVARRGAPILFTLPGQLYDVDPSRSGELPRAALELSGSGPRPIDAEQRLGVPLYLLDVNRPFERWTVLARVPGGADQIPFSELGLASDREYWVFEFWSKTLRGAFEGSFAPGPVDPNAGVQVFCIRARQPRPQVLATNRHVSCGGADLRTVAWRGDTLVGESDVVARDVYTVYLSNPRDWHLNNATADGATVLETPRTGMMRAVTMRSRTAGRVGWRLVWSRDHSPVP